VKSGTSPLVAALLIELTSLKILQHLALEKGNTGIVSEGANVGKIGKIVDMVPGKMKEDVKIVCEIEGKTQEILKDRFVVIGKEKPGVGHETHYRMDSRLRSSRSTRKVRSPWLLGVTSKVTCADFPGARSPIKTLVWVVSRFSPEGVTVIPLKVFSRELPMTRVISSSTPLLKTSGRSTMEISIGVLSILMGI
jgi:hypothetical protein